MKRFICVFFLIGVICLLTTNCSKDESKPDPNTVTDIDGNVYHTVKIGTQTWMVENLKTTKYRNGDPIPNLTDNDEWSNSTTGAYCNYNNDESKAAVYGRIYNWYAANNVKNIAPEGWHVPTVGEWEVLINFLGGEGIAGGKLKETGTTHWKSPNSGATNETGFTALPSGYRDFYDGSFKNLGNSSCFWVSTESYGYDYWANYLTYDGINIDSYGCYEYGGFSVRCIKD